MVVYVRTGRAARMMEAALTKGRYVTVELEGGTHTCGWVHAVDKSAGLAVVEDASGGELVLLALAAVRKIASGSAKSKRVWPEKCTSLCHAPATTRALTKKPSCLVDGARVDVGPVLRARHAEYTRIGVDVTAEAQRVFDALAKTLPCRWDRDTIVVLDSVRLSRPYSAGDMG